MTDETSGTFLVTSADDETAVLSAVDGGRVHTLSSNPGVEEGEVIEATLVADPPLEVTWRVVAIEERRSPAVAVRDDPPSERAREIASGQSPGDLDRRPLDDGELHVLSVPPGRTEDAMAEVAADEATLVRAARLGATRVEIRGNDGVISVRYE